MLVRHKHAHTKTYALAPIGQFVNWMECPTDPSSAVKAKELLAFMQLVQLDAWPRCSGRRVKTMDPQGRVVVMLSGGVMMVGRCDDGGS